MIENFNSWQNTVQRKENAESEWFEKRKAEIEAKRKARLDKLNAPVEVDNSPEAVRLMELRRAVQMFVGTLDADTQLEDMMAVATVFPKYQAGKAYRVKDVFSYGVNGVGDPQLYQVLQAHTSAEHWTPDATPSLYKAIGITQEGYPEWVQPLGATDAYEYGDVVSYNGKTYRSIYEGANAWSPEANPSAWELMEVEE